MSEKLRRLQKGTPEDWPSLALLEFTVALARMMKANGDMKQKDLADRLGVSPPYISSVMSGNENLTVEQMSRLAEAAGGSLHLTIAPQGLYIRWVEDTFEEEAVEAAISPSLHGREAALKLPMIYPLSAPALERIAHVSYGKTYQPPPPTLAPRMLGAPLGRPRPGNFFSQSGRPTQ